MVNASLNEARHHVHPHAAHLTLQCFYLRDDHGEEWTMWITVDLEATHGFEEWILDVLLSVLHLAIHIRQHIGEPRHLFQICPHWHQMTEEAKQFRPVRRERGERHAQEQVLLSDKLLQ